MSRNNSIKGRSFYYFILSSLLVIIAVVLISGGAVLILTFLLIALVIFYPLFSLLWDKFYGLEDIADRLYYARTKDGWDIAMHYHEPPNPRPGAFPVIFSHGIVVNKFGVDMDHAHSLAYFLKKNGFPVFVLSLRGVGRSRYHSGKGFHDFNFDDIVEYDVPAVIKRAQELTGSPQVNWIGHSMGAMIASAYLSRKLPESDQISTLISLGGPGKLDHVESTFWGFLSRHRWLNRVVDLKYSARAISPLSGRSRRSIEALIINRDIVSGETIRRLLKNGVENVAPGLSNQFTDWVRNGKETTVDGSFNYREGFCNIKTPALFIAGARDRLAPPECVKFVYDSITSRNKSFHIIGKERGYPADYCHTGLVLADRAIIDVFPLVLDWLLQHGCQKKIKNPLKRLLKKIKRKRNKNSVNGNRQIAAML